MFRFIVGPVFAIHSDNVFQFCCSLVSNDILNISLSCSAISISFPYKFLTCSNASSSSFLILLDFVYCSPPLCHRIIASILRRRQPRSPRLSSLCVQKPKQNGWASMLLKYKLVLCSLLVLAVLITSAILLTVNRRSYNTFVAVSRMNCSEALQAGYTFTCAQVEIINDWRKQGYR